MWKMSRERKMGGRRWTRKREGLEGQERKVWQVSKVETGMWRCEWVGERKSREEWGRGANPAEAHTWQAWCSAGEPDSLTRENLTH